MFVAYIHTCRCFNKNINTHGRCNPSPTPKQLSSKSAKKLRRLFVRLCLKAMAVFVVNFSSLWFFSQRWGYGDWDLAPWKLTNIPLKIDFVGSDDACHVLLKMVPFCKDMNVFIFRGSGKKTTPSCARPFLGPMDFKATEKCPFTGSGPTSMTSTQKPPWMGWISWLL